MKQILAWTSVLVLVGALLVLLREGARDLDGGDGAAPPVETRAEAPPAPDGADLRAADGEPEAPAREAALEPPWEPVLRVVEVVDGVDRPVPAGRARVLLLTKFGDGSEPDMESRDVPDDGLALAPPTNASSVYVLRAWLEGLPATLLAGDVLERGTPEATLRLELPGHPWELRLWDAVGRPLTTARVLRAPNPYSYSPLPPDSAVELEELSGRHAIHLPPAPAHTYWFGGEGLEWRAVEWLARASVGHDLTLRAGASIELDWEACEGVTSARWIDRTGLLHGDEVTEWRRRDGPVRLDGLSPGAFEVAWDGPEPRRFETVGRWDLPAGAVTTIAPTCDRDRGGVTLVVRGLTEVLGRTEVTLHPERSDSGLLESMAPDERSQAGGVLHAHWDDVPEGLYALRVGPLCLVRVRRAGVEERVEFDLPTPESRRFLFVSATTGETVPVKTVSWSWLPEGCDLPTTRLLPICGSEKLDSSAVLEIPLGPGQLRAVVDWDGGVRFLTVEIDPSAAVQEVPVSIDPVFRVRIHRESPILDEVLRALRFRADDGTILPDSGFLVGSSGRTLGVPGQSATRRSSVTVTHMSTLPRAIWVPAALDEAGGTWVEVEGPSGVLDLDAATFTRD